ncbi:hypothetical protein [Leifsonia sp. TF02-11]|uniref:hypothetical protein n=1 Tax=Leifsonia sp. TF02-11 TaxID=2815212 RepID=UPI001AA18B13|nr:hypothetical protein [Leifsonia sp. TF02-11]MBO1741178.1 hypothetical protein [Leifsonia sp. TF02-11]
MLKKILAAVAVTAALLLAAPAAANAVGYPSGAPCTFDVSSTQAGHSATLICVPGTWRDGETITWVASGSDGASIVMASSVTFSKHANADGSDVLRVTLPADASGLYTVVGTGAASGHVCSATLTVIPADTSASAINDPGSSGLADTGSVIAQWAIWTGAGLLVIGLVSVAVAAWMRKVRSS